MSKCNKILVKIPKQFNKSMKRKVEYRIDSIDLNIIEALRKNGRESYVHLAKVLGVSEATVRARVKNLINRDIIMVTANPNPTALGYVFIGIVAIQVAIPYLGTVAEELSKAQNVCYLVNVTGRYDFIAIVMTSSANEFSDFIEKVISTIPGISRTETFVSLKTLKGRWFTLDFTELAKGLDVSPRKRL